MNAHSSSQPLQALRQGHWCKLICGASFQHLPTIEHLTRAYALAGVDCIDVAADPVVVALARQVLDNLPAWDGVWPGRPWLMVSLNDGDDPHFRKAQFHPAHCPPDCPRPCQSICPTQAIPPLPPQYPDVVLDHGVEDDRCYGCGRCITVCPQGLITARSHLVPTATLLPQLMDVGIDALEIHTQVGHGELFTTLWRTIVPWLSQLQLLAISCPHEAGAVDYLWSLYHQIGPLPCPLLWQVDGRPMSGDIGSGTTHTTLTYAQAMIDKGPPGYLQLAGGTNGYTLSKLKALGLRGVNSEGRAWIGGIAYGGYGRQLLDPLLREIPQDPDQYDAWLRRSVHIAKTLVDPLKAPVLD